MQAKLVPDLGSCLESSFITETEKNKTHTANEGVQTIPAGKEINMEADASVDQDERKSEKSSISSQGEINMKADALVNNTAGQGDNPDGELTIEDGISLEAGASIDNFCQSPTRTVVKGHLKNKPLGKISGDTKIEADAFVDNFAGKETNMEADASVDRTAGQDERKPDEPPVDGQISKNISIEAEVSVDNLVDQMAWIPADKERIPNLSTGDEQMEDATSVEADASVDNPGDKKMMEDDIGIEADASITAENSVGEISVAVSETNILATRSSHSLMCIEFDQNNVNPEQTMLTENYMQDLGACMDPSLLRVTEGSQQCTATESKEEGSKFRDDKIKLASGFEGLLAEDQTAVEQVLTDAGALDIEMVEDSSDLDRRERQPSAEVCDITHGVGIDTVSQDMNTNQDDTQMVSTLESHLVRLGIENPVDHHAAGIDQSSEEDENCQPYPGLQLGFIQHFGLNLQSGDNDPIGAEVEETLTESIGTSDTDDAVFNEQGSESECSGPKQWDPGGSQME